MPEIVATLSAMETPVVDRATCERLFGVRRRRAIELLKRFGGYHGGNVLLADRARLIQQLQTLETTPDVLHECRRQQRLAGELDRLRRSHAGAAVRIEVPRPPGQILDSTLPVGVSITPGKLVIEFVRVEELFSRLYGLAQAVAADYEGFSAACSMTGGP